MRWDDVISFYEITKTFRAFLMFKDFQLFSNWDAFKWSH